MLSVRPAETAATRIASPRTGMRCAGLREHRRCEGTNVVAAAVIFAMLATAETSLPHVVDLLDDLNGDGRVDSVRVAFHLCHGGAGEPGEKPCYDAFHAIAGGDSIRVHGEYLHGTAFVVDVDSTDGFREIAVPEWGPSDDDAVHFLRLAADGLRVVGMVPNLLLADLKIDGSGVIATTCRGRILHTWYYPCTYRMFKETGTLLEVPQAFKVMNAHVRLKRDLPVLESPVHHKVTGVIKQGESATVEITDDQVWCRIRARDGTVGWFRIENGRVWLPLERALVLDYEVFDGLSDAD